MVGPPDKKKDRGFNDINQRGMARHQPHDAP